MKDSEKIESGFSSEKELDKIRKSLQKYPFDEYEKVDHYHNSILAKGTDENELRKIYLNFENIFLVLERKRENGKNNLDIYYMLDKDHYALFAIDLKPKKPKMLNAFISSKNYKKFLRSIVKRYGNKLN